MDTPNAHPLESRPPTVKDLVLICRSLNEHGARYVVIGGFAVNQHGFSRATMDIDLLLDDSSENQARVKEALEVLPDKAVRQLGPDDLNKYVVVRVADEVVVDLMIKACGITYAQAEPEIQIFSLEGVPIPFASVSLREGHGGPAFSPAQACGRKLSIGYVAEPIRHGSDRHIMESRPYLAPGNAVIGARGCSKESHGVGRYWRRGAPRSGRATCGD